MLVYFLISILINYRSSEAAPLPLTPKDLKSCPKRTLFGIVWSCISTIIICAWTSVHPNVPPPNKWKARWNRLRLMFWMIIAPELVLAWAVRQYFAAKKIRDTYNERESREWKQWTLAHGHFFGMGGFTNIAPADRDAKPNEQHGTVLAFDYLKQNRNINIPEMTTAEIEDRSKGDAVWKMIAILQTTWFNLQCIARGQQRLALTELELVTLALASLNAATFVIWWHKPLGVMEPVKMYVETEAQTSTERAHPQDSGQSVDLSFRDVISKVWDRVKVIAANVLEFLENPCKLGSIIALLRLFVVLPIALTFITSFPFVVLCPLGIVLLLRIIKPEPVTPESSPNRGILAAQIIAFLYKFRYWLTSIVSEFVGNRLKEIFAERHNGSADFISQFLFGWFILLPSLFLLLLLFILFLIPFLTLLYLVSFIFTAVFDIVTTSTVHPGASHVSSFYALTTDSDRWSRMVVVALFGAFFGGLHCIGWYFEYPTHSEETLWRATSLAITVIPLVVAPIDFLLFAQDIKSCGRVLLILDLIMTILLFIYVLARLSLLVQALVLLRDQPTSALDAVDWTNYIPRLFS